MNKILTLLICSVLTFSGMNAQRTVGLLSYKPWLSYDGYNLLYLHNQSNIFLIDNCGEIVHLWEGQEDRRPGNTAYLTDDGNLVYTHRASNVTTDPIWAGGGSETVEIVNWDNESLWAFSLNTETERLHHDIAIMPNGNILMIVWELKTEAEAIAMGRDTTLLPQNELWPDKIIEVNPETDEIVWEWHVWDHLIQDFDDSKANFGVISENIGKVNINYDTNDGHPDWMHTNALDFDPVNNHVLLSVPTFNEIWVIDHSTTTEEAATSSGGFSGKGGDLIYRWGNPAAYNKGSEEDTKLFYQHDVQIIDDFLIPSHPLYGKFAAFNNRIGEDFSSIAIWDNPYDMYDAEFLLQADGTYEPADYKISKTHPIPQKMHSTGLSSIQVLPNSNFLITDGRHGYTFEMTRDDEIVWEYVTPLKSGFPVTQGDSLDVNDNLTFRVKRYPKDFAGFEGKDLQGNGFIELGGNEEFCDQILPIEMNYRNDDLKIYPNPADNVVTIEWESMQYENIAIVDMMGRTIEQHTLSGGRVFLDISQYSAGTYFVKTSRNSVKKFIIY